MYKLKKNSFAAPLKKTDMNFHLIEQDDVGILSQ